MRDVEALDDTTLHGVSTWGASVRVRVLHVGEDDTRVG